MKFHLNYFILKQYYRLASLYICSKIFKVTLATYTKEFSYNLRLAYPIILGMLGHTVVGIVDNIMVGKLGPTELAAVSLGNSFIFIAMDCICVLS